MKSALFNLHNVFSFRQAFLFEYACHEQLQDIVEIYVLNGIEQRIYQILFWCLVVLCSSK